MLYAEEHRDLFSVPEDYVLVQCISADFAMSKGIAKEFNKHFNTKSHLVTKYTNMIMEWQASDTPGFTVRDGRVICLVTKERYWEKPSYLTMEKAIQGLRAELESDPNIKKIAMPLIGCGLDRLSWIQVRTILRRELKSWNGEVLVCVR